MATFQQFLKENGYISADQYKKVQAEQASVRNSTFFSAVKRTQAMTDEELVEAACKYFDYGRIDDAFELNIDFTATGKFAGDIFKVIEMRAFMCKLDGKLTCVMSDPENELIKNKVSTALGGRPPFAIITDAEFTIIHQYHLVPRAVNEQSGRIKVAELEQTSKFARKGTSVTQDLLDMLINAALTHRASDLHLQPVDEGTAKVVLRVDGKLQPYAQIKSDTLPNLRNRLRTMAEVGGESLDRPVEGQIQVPYNGKLIDVRINIVKSKLGFDFNLRFIESSLKELEELGLTEENYNHYMHLLRMTKGLVILCGPTGSGKTSLLYAGFKKQLTERKAICTIEDPVEIVLPGVTQMEVKQELHMTYEKLFPSVLRHDPDIIGIGEIRTVEVAAQTVQAANTGHLVFSTIHTNDALGAIPRLIGLGIEPYMLGDVLSAVIAQRLVRRVCTQCSEEHRLEEDHPWRERYGLGNGEVKLRRGKGCAHCGGTGYYGRIAVNEFMIASPELKDAVQKNATRNEMEQILRESGYQTYLEDAIEKAKLGITTFNDVDELYYDYPGAKYMLAKHAKATGT